ncbi:MAG TPA: lycopene cyclase domain-containing protein [Myxococcaceae bacterium]|jgi:lycopene cyclase domain-containing protein|nr:lycopene cyclase domain-containing protein [Myxococcaceae bacterium]
MTYGRFLLLFLVLPLGVLALRGELARGPWRPLLLVLGLAYAATTPWDAWAVAHGLWAFPPGKVWGPRLLGLPLEEYCFFGLQTLLTGLWVRRRLERLAEPGGSAA